MREWLLGLGAAESVRPDPLPDPTARQLQKAGHLKAKFLLDTLVSPGSATLECGVGISRKPLATVRPTAQGAFD
jgi:hypothetical protein